MTKVWMLQSFLKGRIKIFTGGDMETKFGAKTEWMAIQSLPHLGIQAIYIQPPKLDNIYEVKKCMLIGAWYSCLLICLAKAYQIPRRILAAKYWTENRVSTVWGTLPTFWSCLPLHWVTLCRSLYYVAPYYLCLGISVLNWVFKIWSFHSM